MKAFVGGDGIYDTSISLDASTIGDVTAAVGVVATRRGEVEILESILEAAQETGVEFVPFKSKSRHYDKREDRKFFERVIRDHEERISSFHFRHRSASRNQHYVEAVLSALLVSDVISDVEIAPLVIIDGDEQKTTAFARAAKGTSMDKLPPIANCYQAELYYPHSLLADLTAGYLAKRIDSGVYDYADPLLRSPAADRVRSDQWGTSFNHLRTKSPGFRERANIGSSYGQTERERVKIWFSALMGRQPSDSSPSIPFDHVKTRIREDGYVLLADELEGM